MRNLPRLFELSPLFTDHMVLQREAAIPIWGTAENGRKIQVELCGQKKAAVCANGQWRVILTPLLAGGPFTMKISCGDDLLVLQDVLLGDVYIAAGQSNMEFMLQDELHGKEAIAAAEQEAVRYYDLPRIEFEDGGRRVPDLPEASWEICTPQSAAHFSAIAHYFAQEIAARQQVPVGIINCSKGGTSASCWLSEQALNADPELQDVYWLPYQKAVACLSDEEEDEQMEAYQHAVAVYEQKLADYEQEHPHEPLNEVKRKVGHTPWPPPAGRKCFVRPCGLYHTMLQKIVPYRAKAVLWYQGEEDTSHPELYARLLQALIFNWRKDFTSPRLPFLIVQLPSYEETGEQKPQDSWARLRDAQLQAVRSTEETGLVVTLDTGEAYNVHPADKHPIAMRLARLAEEMLYHAGRSGQSPLCKTVCRRGRSVEAEFVLSPGDAFCANGQELQGFELCGRDGCFRTAKARIAGADRVIVTQPLIEHPTAVRYGWKNYFPQAQLITQSGLLASPFCEQI